MSQNAITAEGSSDLAQGANEAVQKAVGATMNGAATGRCMALLLAAAISTGLCPTASFSAPTAPARTTARPHPLCTIPPGPAPPFHLVYPELSAPVSKDTSLFIVAVMHAQQLRLKITAFGQTQIAAGLPLRLPLPTPLSLPGNPEQYDYYQFRTAPLVGHATYMADLEMTESFFNCPKRFNIPIGSFVTY
ncbi:MAG: hypothetical protein NVS1B14_08290 [Vulcanimicrobiaceae bacterium]